MGKPISKPTPVVTDPMIEAAAGVFYHAVHKGLPRWLLRKMITAALEAQDA